MDAENKLRLLGLLKIIDGAVDDWTGDRDTMDVLGEIGKAVDLALDVVAPTAHCGMRFEIVLDHKPHEWHGLYQRDIYRCPGGEA
jgi:hypothetical protein